MRWLFPPRSSLFVSLSLVLSACSSGREDTEGSQSTVRGDDETATEGPATEDEPAPATPSEPETGMDDVDPTVPVDVNLPPLVVGGAAGNDAGVEPEPSMTAEPAVPGEPEMTAEPVPVEPEPVAMEPEPVAMEPEPVAMEPEPVATEPEPAITEPEPVVTEPEPSACDTQPQCDLVCPAGTVNPVDKDGCVNTCECEGLPDACSQCTDGDEECIQVGQDADAKFACAEVMDDCQSLLPCGCFEDYEGCSLSSQNVGLCTCPAPMDPCGGCDAGKTCIFQAGGPNPSYLCAAESDCQWPGTCWCILQQGACRLSDSRGVCQCDNGL